MERNGLTVSMVFEAESANYGEGFGNITVLKKMGRSDHKQYTYISRQALRYNIMQQAAWDNTPVDGKSGVVQFAPETTIVEYPEIDLFGYLKTSAKKEKEKGGSNKRSAVVRLSNAIALEPFQGDMDYLTNMGLASRGGLDNAIAQSEIHKSMYAYTVTIDLDRVGVDGKVQIAKEERAARVKTFLETVQFLYRDIKGRRENLNPVFAVGGLYQRKNPYFENRLRLDRNCLDVSLLREVLNSADDVKINTTIGYMSGSFANDKEIKEELQPISVAALFEKIKGEVDACYE